MPYVLDLLRRSRRLFVTLMKVMLPVMIAVQIAEHLGWVEALGHAIAPAMGLLRLPPEAGLIWVTGVFVGVYGAIAAMIGLAASLDMTAGQLSALCAMVLFAHALPVEQAIVRRAGASFWATAALRLGVAIVYGGSVAWFSAWSGMLTEPMSLAWLQGNGVSTGAGVGGAGVGGAGANGSALAGWLQGTAFSLAITFAIIVALLLLLDALQRSGITPRFTAALTPLLKFSGLESRAAPVTTVGVLLGLSYGGALIIDEAERQQFSARTRFLALSWLSLSHSLIEDTALLVALGADIWIVLVGRVLVTLLVVAALARLLGGGDRASAPLAPQAG